MPMEAQSASLSGALAGIGWAGVYVLAGCPRTTHGTEGSPDRLMDRRYRHGKQLAKPYDSRQQQ